MGGKMKKMIAKCICCGKECEAGIPYSICESCKNIIQKFIEADNSRKKIMMQSLNIIPECKFDTGDEDIDLFLETIWLYIAEIEFRLHFIKNSMLNIQTRLKGVIK